MIRADDAMPSGALDRQFCPMASCAAYNVSMSLTQSRFAVGQLVRFIAPLNEDEREEQFTVLELRGERVLVEFVCGMSIRPTFVYLAADLVQWKARQLVEIRVSGCHSCVCMRRAHPG